MRFRNINPLEDISREETRSVIAACRKSGACRRNGSGRYPYSATGANR
jgi:hypothetical protein